MMSLLDEDRPCTIQELENIITAPTGGLVLLPSSAYDEVCEGIFIGEGDSAKSPHCMKNLGVTHVLNAALGKTAFHVNTNHVMYKRLGIEFLGIEATDYVNCNLSLHFDKASNFIESGVRAGGKVFVHCVQGVSRSATLVLAYLMIKRHMTVQNAVRLVRKRREICPNPGFLQQLCDLNEQLKKHGHFQPGNQIGPDATSKDVVGEGGDLETGQDIHCSASANARYSQPSGILRKKEPQPCTVEELEDILTKRSSGMMIMSNKVFSQINDFLYIGQGQFASNIGDLTRLGITHVLNAAQNHGIVSNEDMYKEAGIQFLGVKAVDIMDYDISCHFYYAADFLEAASVAQGKAYVHCVAGVSRAPTLVVAYLMLKQHIPVKQAIEMVRARREIYPNTSFLQQLCNLNTDLERSGHFPAQDEQN